MKHSVMPRLILIVLGIGASACGEEPAIRPQPVAVELRELGSDSRFRTQSPGTEPVPASVRVTLRGPGGMRYEEFEYGSHEAALHDLLPGLWEIRADGMRASGEIGWISEKVTISVEAGQTVALTINLQSIPEQ